MNFLQWLEKEGVTIYFFAKNTGLSPSTIYQFVRGDRKLSRDMSMVMHEATKGEVSKDEFLWPTFTKVKKREGRGRPPLIKKEKEA